MTTSTRDLLTREQVANYLNVTPRTARSLFERRVFPTVKIARTVLVERADLDAYIDAQTRPAVAVTR